MRYTGTGSAPVQMASKGLLGCHARLWEAAGCPVLLHACSYSLHFSRTICELGSWARQWGLVVWLAQYSSLGVGVQVGGEASGGLPQGQAGQEGLVLFA